MLLYAIHIIMQNMEIMEAPPISHHNPESAFKAGKENKNLILCMLGLEGSPGRVQKPKE